MNDTSTAPMPALVTGAAGRIGAVLAHRLAAAGHPVLVHFNTSANDAAAVCRSIIASGGRAEPIGADLDDRAQRATLIERAATPFGPLGVLVNNASLFERDSVETLDEALWDRHMRIHAEAPVFLARDFARQLADGSHGNIVNIIDERVWDLSPAYTSYTLSKAALWTATRTMAQSLAPRIRVNAIGPGPTLPEIGQSQRDFDRRAAELPLQQAASPDDLADAMLFLLAAKTVTGQMIAVDGGAHLEWPARVAPTPRET